MKKHLKIISVVFSLALAVCTIQAVFFQALAADEDTTSAVVSGDVINFDANSAGWNNIKYCMCYIYEIGADAFFEWGVKNTRMTDDDGDGVWTYDLSKLSKSTSGSTSIESGKYYAVIFFADTGVMTADLLLTTDCFGDTAYVKDQNARQENTSDSNRQSYVAYWKTNTQWGVLKCVTSIGNVVGDQIPPTTSAYDMFVSFLKYALTNARAYLGKDDQTLIDDTAKALGLDQNLIPQAIKEAGVIVDWEEEIVRNPSYPVSIEVVYAPNTVEVYDFGKYDMSFWNDVVFLITYKDGYTEYFQSEFYDDGWAKELPKHYAGKPIPIIVPTELIGDTFDIEFCNYHALLEVNSIYVDDISNPELPTTDDMKYNEPISSPDEGTKPTTDEGAKSTIDEVATPDSKATDSNTKSTNDNAVVATGDFTVAAGVAVVMLIAAAVMVILNRRKSVLN